MGESCWSESQRRFMKDLLCSVTTRGTQDLTPQNMCSNLVMRAQGPGKSNGCE